MKTTFTLFAGLVLLLITACEPTPEERRAANLERYKSQLENFKKDSFDLLSQKFELFSTFQEAFYKVTEIPTPAEHKELELEFGTGDREKSSCNTIYVNNDYFLSPENGAFPMKHYQHLNNIKRLVNGETLVWEEDDEFSLFELGYFLEFCKSFIEADYLAIERSILYQEPKMVSPLEQGRADLFEAGYYKSLFVLFRFDNSQEVLDAFVLEATNDETIERFDKSSLVQNILTNVRKTIEAEVGLRYTYKGTIPYRMSEN